MTKYLIAILLSTAFFLAKPTAAEEIQLDQLFSDLKSSKDQLRARKLEGLIWQRWFESGNDEIDALMQQAIKKRRIYDFNGSLSLLNRVIQLKPEYAEAWNQRATVLFHQQAYEKSLTDIAKALELEPRHFGAMAGRAMIRLYQNKPALARQNISQALQYHPFLREREMFPGL